MLPVLSVTQLNREVRLWIEQEGHAVCVEGELSNLSRPVSGHLYFTLKDTHAQVRCVYFKNKQYASPLKAPINGLHVIVKGQLSLYEARGDFQLLVESLEEAGQGDLFQQFERLKTTLAALGLFDPARKKPLPPYPLCIGIITSSSGAALHDILTTLKRRYPLASVLIYPSDVQGRHAAKQLIHALQQAVLDNRCDVIILARGGGSMEDLWAFNDETLAHCIANSPIPIISGVGHETDFTIADFVADLRAATPTAAAEAATPNQHALLAYLDTLQQRLLQTIQRAITHQQLLLNHAMHQLSAPRQQIRTQWQRLDYLTNQLDRSINNRIVDFQHQMDLLLSRIRAKNPSLRLQQSHQRLTQLEQQLSYLVISKFHQTRHYFSTLLTTLQAVSPLATLERGYAIASHADHVLLDGDDVHIGDDIHLRLARGHLICRVVEKPPVVSSSERSI